MALFDDLPPMHPVKVNRISLFLIWPSKCSTYFQCGDSSIRKMLRSAYTDFVGEELELQMNQNASSMVPKMSFTADKGWADLSQLQNRAELKLFWDMFIQKQIFIFEQESALLVEVSKEENW